MADKHEQSVVHCHPVAVLPCALHGPPSPLSRWSVRTDCKHATGNGPQTLKRCSVTVQKPKTLPQELIEECSTMCSSRNRLSTPPTSSGRPTDVRYALAAPTRRPIRFCSLYLISASGFFCSPQAGRRARWVIRLTPSCETAAARFTMIP